MLYLIVMAKILFISNSDSALYVFRKELLQSLLDEGNQLVVVASFDKYRTELESMGCVLHNVKTDRRGMNPLKDYSLYRSYVKALKEHAPDIVLTYTIKSNIYGGMAAKKLNFPYYANITGLGTGFKKGLVRRIVITLYRRAFKKVSKVFFQNQSNMQVFLENRIIKEEKAIMLAGSGVNLEKYSFTVLEDNPITKFLFVGRIMREKGVDEFLYSATHAKEEGLPAQFEILGSFEEDYRSILEKMQVDGIIHHHEYQKDVTPIVLKSHCVVLPSYHEGMSNTLLEGGAMGRPLIASDIPGCREAILDGKNGFTVKKSDKEDLYQKIKEFCELDFEKKQAMGKASRMHIEENFDRQTVVADIKKSLSEIAGEKQ